MTGPDKRTGARGGVLPLDRLEHEFGYVLADVSVRPHSHGWHGNAIFIRSCFADHEPQRIELPSIEPRGAVSVLLHKPKLEIVGVHLGLTRNARRKQIGVLQSKISERKHPVLLAGDFNEWNLEHVLFDETTTIVSPGPSFHAARPTVAFDRFILGPGLSASSAHVHSSKLAKRASDHLPIVIDMKSTEIQ